MGLYEHIFAAAYDRFMARQENAGLGELRAALVPRAAGDVLEIGAGTGVNVAQYTERVTSLTLLEPNSAMARKIRARLDDCHRQATVRQGVAGELPFGDASFDTVVMTLVLCTVPEPLPAIDEAARVLRPGGTFLFLEHVRAEEPRLAAWQDRLSPFWRRFGCGCNPNRDTLAALGHCAALDVGKIEAGDIPGAVPIVKPYILGAATKPTQL